MNVNFRLFCTFSDQMENCPIHINKVKDWTFRFQKHKYTCLIMASNARNNTRNDTSKFLEKLKQAFQPSEINHVA